MNSSIDGEFPSQRPVTRSFDVIFDLCLKKKQFSTQSRCWWFETPSCPLWRHCNYVDVRKERATAIDMEKQVVDTHRHISKIRHTECQNFNVSRLILQLPFSNALTWGVKSRMKMQLERCRQVMLQLQLGDDQLYFLLRYAYIKGLMISLVCSPKLARHHVSCVHLSAPTSGRDNLNSPHLWASWPHNNKNNTYASKSVWYKLSLTRVTMISNPTPAWYTRHGAVQNCKDILYFEWYHLRNEKIYLLQYFDRYTLPLQDVMAFLFWQPRLNKKINSIPPPLWLIAAPKTETLNTWGVSNDWYIKGISCFVSLLENQWSSVFI